MQPCQEKLLARDDEEDDEWNWARWEAPWAEIGFRV